MQKKKVVLFKRKPIPGRYFSIEIIFDELVKVMPPDFDYLQRISKRYSKGVLPRLMSMLDASAHQGDVNHITGDEHFLALLMNRNKTILTVHDCRFLEHPNFILRRLLKLFWLTLPLKRIRLVTVVSEKTKQDIMANSSFDPGRIIVVPNFVFGYFKKADHYPERKRPVILQVGITYNKNIERVADALRGIDCELLIIGKPTDLQEKILKDNCIRYRYQVGLSNEEVYQQYVNCNMVMFASTLEGFGLPIIEANTVGRPVITSNFEPMTSVAGGSAALVDPYDTESIRNAVLKIMNDTDYRNTLIEKGFENAKRYTIERVAEMYHDLYQQIAKA